MLALPLLDHTAELVAEGLAPGIGLVDPAHTLIVEVLRRRGAAQLLADPAVDARHHPVAQRAFDVAEQNHAGLFRLVLHPVHVGFIEHHVFTIAPGVDLAIDEDAAVVGVGRGQAQVITQRTGKRVAVRVEVAATRQQRKHCALDVGDAADQRHGLRAQGLGRWQRFVVPLEVEALPALLEKRTETGVVVLFGGADVPLVEQVHRLFANHFPVVLEHIQLGELAAVQVRLGRHSREQIHQSVIRGEQRRMVDELAQHRQTGLAAQVHIQRAADKQQQHRQFGGQRKGHAATPGNKRLASNLPSTGNQT